MAERMKISQYKKKIQDQENLDSPVKIIRPIRPKTPNTPRNMQVASVRYKPAESPVRKPATLQRSHTDINIKQRQNDVSAEPKKKSYDPAVARKFIQEQKIRRKSHADDSADGKVSKDEIKKRLEDLKKNSRRILSDNVNKKRRSNSTPRNMSFAPEKVSANKPKPKLQNATPKKAILTSRKIEEIKENIPENKVNYKIKPIAKKQQEEETILKSKSHEMEMLLKKEEELLNSLSTQKLAQKAKTDLISSKTPKSRVGLLRKPETEDEPSFTTLKQFNLKQIENKVVMDVFTPIVSNTVSKVEELNKKLEDNQKEVCQPNKEIEDLSLKVPEAQLKSNVSVPIQTQTESLSQSGKKEIPYWLKPSPVQMYPYNFIMAVRKKLEAIANPAVARSNQSKIISKQHIEETPCAKVDPKKLQNVRRRIETSDVRKKISPIADLSVRFTAIENNSPANDSSASEKSPEIRDVTLNSSEKYLSQVESSKKTVVSIQENLNKIHEISHVESDEIPKEESFSKTFLAGPKESEVDLNKVHELSNSNIEDYSSNFSEDQTKDTTFLENHSKTLKTFSKSPRENLNKVHQLPQSDMSNFSSVSIHLPNANEDDTTISSSVFSSPEKKGPIQERSTNASPLNLDVVSNLCLSTLPKSLNSGRGDFLEDNHSYSRLDSKTKSYSESVNINQLLEDFNKSLSHVMEVNNQLKNTLDKSHQIFSPRTAKRKEKARISTIEEYLSSRSSEETTPLKSSSHNNRKPQIEEVYSTDFENSNNEESILIMKSPAGALTTVIRKNPTVSVFSAKEKKSNSISESVNTESISKLTEPEEVFSEIVTESTLEESPVKDNQSLNKFSRDSLEVKSDEDSISKALSSKHSHINICRGDFNEEKFRINSSISSEFIAVFNNSEIDIDVSCNSNYSSIGMYEQLIQAENDKTEQLVTLLKMREKAIIDRTKGQIAWLEVQKEKYKAKGLTAEISSIRKKQRGVLLKMEKERDEIRRLVQQNEVKKQHSTSSAIAKSPLEDLKQRSDIYIRKSIGCPKSPRIIKGFELESSKSLENLLRRREEELQKRREDVERLMKWHQRLDNEEEEVLQLEKLLFEYNAKPRSGILDEKLERKLKEIDSGLRDLSCVTSDERVDYVRTSGAKLNKLWRRLTGEKSDRFDPKRKYKLCKKDLEKFYEEAKRIVLIAFGENPADMKDLFEQSSFNNSANSAVLPKINTSGSSEESEFTAAYSPKKSEEQFQKTEEASSEDVKTLTEEPVTRSEPYTNDFEDISTDWMEKSTNTKTIISDLDSSPTGSIDQSTEKPVTEEIIEEQVISEEVEESLVEDIPIPNKIKEKKSDKEEQNDLEKRLLDLDVSLKGLQTSFEKALSPEKPSSTSVTVMASISPPKSPNLMPDIINEVELRRRQQIIIENEMKQFENTLPYIYVREIPNKPPPPYVPPAHGSPMTTIFPSEQRIKDITFRRSKELFYEIFETETPTKDKLPSILEENITNIYERIILDICKECINDYKSSLNAQTFDQYKDSLALYNPPDRLKCVQNIIYKKVRKFLGMDSKSIQNQKKPFSIYGTKNRKIDNVDEIIIQELYEEEHKWTNFDEEEAEIKSIIIDEILNDVIKDVVKDECLENGVHFDEDLNNSKETSVDE